MTQFTRLAKNSAARLLLAHRDPFRYLELAESLWADSERVLQRAAFLELLRIDGVNLGSAEASNFKTLQCPRTSILGLNAQLSYPFHVDTGDGPRQSRREPRKELRATASRRSKRLLTKRCRTRSQS
jgi:hypothetical protein